MRAVRTLRLRPCVQRDSGRRGVSGRAPGFLRTVGLVERSTLCAEQATSECPPYDIWRKPRLSLVQ